MERDLDAPIQPYDPSRQRRDEADFADPSNVVDILEERAESWDTRSNKYTPHNLPQTFEEVEVVPVSMILASLYRWLMLVSHSIEHPREIISDPTSLVLAQMFKYGHHPLQVWACADRRVRTSIPPTLTRTPSTFPRAIPWINTVIRFVRPTDNRFPSPQAHAHLPTPFRLLDLSNDPIFHGTRAERRHLSFLASPCTSLLHPVP